MESCLEPWPHLELDEFLKDAQVLKDWPIDNWKPVKHSDSRLADGTYRRKYQPVAIGFPVIAKQLLSDETKQFFCDAFNVSQELYPVANLIEDAPGYWIRLHPDCDGKVITCQIYLADDDIHQTQGVILQTLNAKKVKQIPYLFNKGYAFKVSKSSWHRVRPCPSVRKSLQLIYYDTPR